MALTGINAYQKGNVKQSIATADPHKLTLMLMQGALDNIAVAKGAMERKEFQTKGQKIARATAILLNLRDTLDLEIGGDFAENMYALYDYMVDRLTAGHTTNNTAMLDEVIGLLLPIKDAWSKIPEEAKQEAYETQRQRRQAV